MSMFLIQLTHHPSLPKLSFRENSGTLATSQEQPVHLNSAFFKEQPMAEETEEGRELAGWTTLENGRVSQQAWQLQRLLTDLAGREWSLMLFAEYGT